MFPSTQVGTLKLGQLEFYSFPHSQVGARHGGRLSGGSAHVNRQQGTGTSHAAKTAVTELIVVNWMKEKKHKIKQCCINRKPSIPSGDKSSIMKFIR
jgi:hypothetical protein